MRLTCPRLAGSMALVAALGTLACSAGGETPAHTAGGRGGTGGPSPAVPVSVATVTQKSIPITLNLIGTADAYSTVAVHAQITGELTSVQFKEGDDVRQGQVLFTLDRRPLDAALQQAQANLDRDVAQASYARASAARFQ